jgi:DNA-binding NtrC family response regulator
MMKFTRAQARALQAYDWPGNIRELKNVIERAVILSDGNSLRFDILPSKAPLKQPAPAMPTPTQSKAILTEADMRDFQKQNVLKALEQTRWRVSGERGAAALLGIKPTTLADRIKSYGLKKPNR